MLFVEKYYIYILIIYIKTVVVASCPLPKKSRGSPVRRILTVQNLNLRCDYYYSTLN